ncbi:MAG TPA: VWA domain-containing protein [Bryobacteraceae bacterium]|nr:VWA domain-containing protein [Bryobacteraceae bacterium]
MTRLLACLIASAVAVAPASFSQVPAAQPPQSQPPENVIHVNVNLVQMDATVTDSHGNPVDNLTSDDFEILQDGKPQKITNFSYITTRPAQTNQAKPPAPAKGKVIPPPPFIPKPSEIHRTIALVVDDLGISFEDMARVRSALKKFIDTQVQPGDLVAVVRTGAGMGSLQQFSTDKRMLYAAVDHVKYNALMSRVGVSSFAPLGGGGEGRGIEELRSSVFSVGTLGAIRYVVDGLRELPGRKTVVLFSENLQLFHRNDPDPRVMDGVRNLVDAANRASVVIDTIDTRGLQYYGLTAADDTGHMNARQLSHVEMRRSAQVFRSQDGLVMLAHDTGGVFYQNSNDMLSDVEKAVKDADGYYLIAYHPPADTFDNKTGRPKFHNVKINVKTAGMKVRYRSGFLNHSDALEEPPARTPAEQIRRALYSPFSSGGIHMRLTPLFTNAPAQGSFITGLLHFEAKDLTFSDQPDGWHKGTIDVVAVTFGDQGQTVDSSARSFNITLKGDAYQKALNEGLFFQLRHPVKTPGYYQLRVAVRDESSQQVGSANQFIEVPDVSKNLTLSSLMVAKEMPESKPAATTGEGQVAQMDPKGNPAVRVFKPGDSLAYVYQVLNAQSDPAKHDDLEFHTRLYRDGQQVYEGKPAPLQTVSQQDPKHIVCAGAMKLGPKLVPGDYVLQVIVTDKSNEKRAATQSIDFEVESQ